MMDILLNPPKQTFVTVEQFYGFSYYELACYFCNWGLAVEEKEETIIVFAHSWRLFDLMQYNWRFKDCCEFGEYKKADMYVIKSVDEDAKHRIKKYFKNYMLK